MRILGIDPGLNIVGYAVMDASVNHYEIVTCGSIQTKKGATLANRIKEIYDDLEQIVQTYKPTIASVEELFAYKNLKTISQVYHARGAILLLLEKFQVEIHEYTPLQVKQTLTGYGHATKEQVKEVLHQILQKDTLSKLDDTNDAMAIAICCLRHLGF